MTLEGKELLPAIAARGVLAPNGRLFLCLYLRLWQIARVARTGDRDVFVVHKPEVITSALGD
jgi:hypothetical protein